MTANKMPLLLGNPMGGDAMHVDLDDVDDLFGDGVPLGLHTRPPSKRLLQRLDELRTRGACRTIAWSKTGTIASIVPGGQSIELRYIRADPKDGTWGLSEPTPFAPWPDLAGGPLVHLSWSPTNNSSELAIIDAVGRVLIYNFGANLNRPTLIRRWDTDPVDDLHAVVGTYWLNVVPLNPAKLNPIYGPAVKNENNNNYNYETSSIPSNPPIHPYAGRSAFICVTTNGMLRLFYFSSNGGKIEEATLALETVTSADDLVTHAAVCSDYKNKCMFVAVATASKQVRIVQVVVNWMVPKQENPQQAMPAGGFQFGPPQLLQRHVAFTNWFQVGINNSHLESSMNKISHLEWLPGVPVMATKSFSNPVALIVRSFVPPPNSPYHQEVQSVIDRWELFMEQKETLHPAFEQLGSRRNSSSNTQPASIRLKKLDSIVVSKVVTGISVLSFGKIICFTYTDGSIEYRDRFTLEELYTEVKLDRMNSILEAGFTQRGDISLQTALSPTNLSLVEISEDGKIKWHPISYTLADPSTMSDAQLSAVVAGITAATANAVTSNNNMDDILAIARVFSHKDRFIATWVNELVRLLKITVDYSEEAPHDQLMRNHQMQICLSILHHLGWKGEYQPREFSSKLALIMLNLRNIVILITMANNTNALRGAGNPMDDPDVVNALAGCCKWTVDLLSWLCDSLFCLLNDNKFKGILTNQAQFSQLTSYLHEKNEIALHMVLCSSIRSLLGGVCRRITVLNNLSHRAISHYENNPPPGGGKSSGYGSPLHIAYQKVYRHTSAALINPEAFQTLLASLNREVREVYSKSFAKMAEQASKAQQQQQRNSEDAIARARQHCELQMLLGQAPPSTFQPLIAKFLYQDLAAFRDGPGNGGPPGGAAAIAAAVAASSNSGSGGGGAGGGNNNAAATAAAAAATTIDPARLFFADYDILEVDDTPGALERRRARGAHVDLFKRVEIFRGSSKSGGGGGSGSGSGSHVPWRRCVRCASVMEDVAAAAAVAGGGNGANNNNNRPHLNVMLSQQRNCCCGGRLAWVP